MEINLRQRKIKIKLVSKRKKFEPQYIFFIPQWNLQYYSKHVYYNVTVNI